MDNTKSTLPSFEGNKKIQAARAFVGETLCNIYLTGRAGTGKTTFLKSLQEFCPKQFIVAAPTGVAAVNAGGVTLHSFFQIPLGPFLPGQSDRPQDNRRFFRFSKVKKQIINGLDLLVIDEISMVRADLLDALDAVLRRLRRDDRPFGGVQLLLIGDLFQLPPVTKPDEWNLLSNYYASPYFFSSQALSRSDLVTIELETVYRQSDPDFIRLLNAVRENRMDSHCTDVLNRQVMPDPPDQGYITLTTHNRKAESINNLKLARLGETAHTLAAKVTGDFPSHAFPTGEQLTLKPGAQVMFLRNDASPDKAYFNGTIGQVTHVGIETVTVACRGSAGRAAGESTSDLKDGPVVEVKPVDWENVTYKVNEEEKTIRQEVVGTFKQFPLKLAWAVTIHKSQGLTFERAIVDAKDAFAHGQVYVALSRCTGLDGLVLTAPVPSCALGTDPVVVEFMNRMAPPDQDLAAIFRSARAACQQTLLLKCFDCSNFRRLFFYFLRLARDNRNVLRIPGLGEPAELESQVRDQVFQVSDKFQIQLKGLMAQDPLPETSPVIQARVQKASAWFGKTLDQVFGRLLEKGAVDTDNAALAKQVQNALDNLKREVRVKRAGILSCKDGFSTTAYLRAVSAQAMADAPGNQSKRGSSSSTTDYTELDIAHPDMFQTLKAWRTRTAAAQNVKAFQVAHQKVLVQIAVCLPRSEKSLKALKGVGPATVESYGKELLAMVDTYCNEKKIPGDEAPEPRPAEQAAKKDASTGRDKAPGTDKATPQANTRDISLMLFKDGLSVDKIAEERGLAPTTIQGHLCSFIAKGELAVDQLVKDKEKQSAIAAVVSTDKNLTQMKDELGDDYSYGEIRAVVAHLQHLESGNG
ncbi:HRDC domain-containing protein [Desulfobacter hydrogenophilus]|uniref:HRDC domain-containing protein n=1 Tax=Desulfobacter hydrogenophilus TaxID=2291 RepID=A0A328FEH6_9BACT|nr:helix-turn-helix domain-containing protein [Desulfobacter hydrogenophilus]NDY71530.1 AAA family ATPase [Desulfobacter hydrogenophilus]QBH11914.1 HRDC domain-containing protein [Desulfobacter hydrogenophilus]RAM02556.1 HRDC domain-containing protein [Desulfobacter hydrogenophilus]